MQYAVAETCWGPVVFAAGNGGLKRLMLPGRPTADAQAVARRHWPGAEYVPNLLPRFQAQLQRFFDGCPVAFRVRLDLSGRTDFQRDVLLACAAIPFGETLTYGQLAELVGHPGAARAVGSVMASNLIPIVIPCHRVVAANRQLGGFSAPGGTDTKKRLLQLEAQATTSREQLVRH